jgi:hypothetical protein
MENCLDIFRSYIQELGEKLKIEGLNLDENNDCYLAFDGKYFVKCSIDTEKEQLNFLAYIGAIPEDKASYYRGLLESCYFWKDTAGSNISFDATDGTLTLTQYCDMNMCDNFLFYNILEKFVNAMEHWDTKRLEEWINSTEEEPATMAADPSMPGINMPGMMMFGA